MEAAGCGGRGTEGRPVEDIFLLAFEMFDDGSERFLSVFQETLMNYSLEKGPFSNYFSFVYSRRKKDAFDDVLSRSEQIDSFDKPVGEDESTTLQDHCAAPDAEQPEARYAAEAPLEELTAQILNFAQRHQGRPQTRDEESGSACFTLRT